MAATTLPALLDTGDHASRPAASAVGSGALYSCTDHSLIYQSDGSTWSTWATLGGGGIQQTLLDAKGDLIVASAADTAARLAVGTDGYVLTTDSGEATGLKWAAAAGGGGGTDAPDGQPWNFSPPSSANAKDDEFGDASSQSGPVNGLDAKWSKQNLGTSTWLRLDNAYAPGCLGFDIPTGQTAVQYVYQAVPAGDFTVAVRIRPIYFSDRQMWGPVIVDSSGNGIGIRIDSGNNSNDPLIQEISAWGQTSTTTAFVPSWGSSTFQNLLYVSPMTLYLRKSTDTYYATMTWGDRAVRGILNEVSRAKTFTAAYVGFGRSYGTGVGKLALDYFRIS